MFSFWPSGTPFETGDLHDGDVSELSASVDVDTISNHAIERCLQKLPSILTAETVCDLSDDAVQRIAAEHPEAAADRAQATDKLRVLEAALAELRVLKTHRGPVDQDVTMTEA